MSDEPEWIKNLSAPAYTALVFFGGSALVVATIIVCWLISNIGTVEPLK